MEEVWKDVEEFEGRYEVSNRGAVRSWVDKHGNRRTEPKALKPRKDHKGYLFVTLCKDGKMKNFRIHRMVAWAFVPNPQNLPQVNHLNEDKTDNRACNLEFCTQTYNNNYGTHNEKIAKARLNHPAMSRPVLQFSPSGNLVKEWPSLMEVQRQTGWRHGHISRCCHGKCQSAYQHVWRYSDDVFPATAQDVLF